MKIADLFVDLDIKGNVKVKDALMGVDTGLQHTAELSMAAKAGILGAVLGLEEISRAAVGSAVDLKNFAGATGLSTGELQKWMYLAKMNDVAGEELASTIKGLQNAQAAMSLGKGVPEGALWFGLDPKNNPVEMFDEIAKKLRAIGSDQKQIGIARSMASTLGISDNMFAMLRAGNLSLAGFRKELVLTAADQKKLLAVDREWNQFWFDIKSASEKMVAQDLAEPIVGAVHIMDDAVQEFGDLVKKVKSLTSEGQKAAGVSKPVPGTAYGAAAGAGILGAGLMMGSNPIGWLGGLLLGASALADVYRGKHGKESLSAMVGKDYDQVGLWQMLNGGPMDKRRSMMNAKPDEDMRTGFEKLVDFMSAMMKAGQPIPINSPAGQGIVNNVNITIGPGVRESTIPSRTATEVVRAMNNLPKGGR